MRWVKLHCFFSHHVRAHGTVPQSLCPHYSLHIGTPAEFSSYQTARTTNHPIRNHNFLDLLPQNILNLFTKILKGSLLLFGFLLFLL